MKIDISGGCGNGLDDEGREREKVLEEKEDECIDEERKEGEMWGGQVDW